MENKRIKEKFMGEDEDGGHRCSSRRTYSGTDTTKGKVIIDCALPKTERKTL